MDIATPRHRRGDSHLSFHSGAAASASMDFGTSSILLKEIHSSAHGAGGGTDASAATTTHNPDYAASWEPDCAKRILAGAAAVRGRRPYMVALVGIPGGGKSVSSFLLAAQLERLDPAARAMIMPHDGYHFALDRLRLFANAEDAIYRRGAPDTFDPVALHRDLTRIRDGPEELITVPAFDHAKGDPEPDRHAFDRHQHSVVICEGLYLLHNDDGWEEIADLFDLKIFVDSDVDVCVERLKVRNQCIPGYTPEEIDIRCERVDRVNALTVQRSRDRADLVVQSLATKPPAGAAAGAENDNMPHIPSVLEFPSEPTMERTLTLLTLTDADLAGAEPDTDWTMDIVSRVGRPRGDSMAHHFDSMANFSGVFAASLSRHSRADSVTSAATEPPEPAAHAIGNWVPLTADKIAQGASEMILDHTDDTSPTHRRRVSNRPYMVALVGPPGGGKTVGAFMLANLLEEKGFETMILPHDGYHYYLDHLRTFPMADELIYRRGAPDTFDPFALQRDLDRIRDGNEELIKLPAFDHSRADPEPDTHVFDRNRHKIVICEGLWLLHDSDGWEEIANMFDYRIYMDANIDVCVERVKIRNQCIPGYTHEEIEVRCELVDRVNAEMVQKSSIRADLVVGTIPEEPEEEVKQ